MILPNLGTGAAAGANPFDVLGSMPTLLIAVEDALLVARSGTGSADS
ncbi:hypothetical protein BH24GEM3_BH24GEM3_22460 [soil metagenome]